MRLIVTRPIEQGRAAVQELRAAGVDAVALPLLAIEPLAAPAGGVNSELLHCWSALGTHRLVMFVSANAVAQFFAAAPPAAAWPAQTLAGSTGPGTSAALLAAGVPAANVRAPAPDAPRLDTEALWQVLRHEPWRGARVLVVRGDGGRDWFIDTLREAGAEVGVVTAYRRALPQLSAEQAAVLAAAEARPESHAWHFSSSEAVHNLPRLAAGEGWHRSRAFATHPRIGEAARAVGFVDVHTLAPGLPALLQAWEAWVARGRASDG
jgi:uroporphyrinogen-III synthase